jgi:hypothetical protein
VLKGRGQNNKELGFIDEHEITKSTAYGDERQQLQQIKPVEQQQFLD